MTTKSDFHPLGWAGGPSITQGRTLLGLGCALLLLAFAVGCGGGGSSSSAVTSVQAPPVTVSISPATASVQTGAMAQFTATVLNTTNTAVTWQVNGVSGGNSTVGTISASGLYMAPSTVPTPATVTVTAVSQAAPSASASATVTVTAKTEVPSATYYVAPDGNDSFSGTLAAPNSTSTDGPFKTLPRAQQAVQSAKSSETGSIAVEIRTGTYYLSAPLSFTSADSGSSSQEITWEGYPGDSTPVISGGMQVKGWTNTSGNTWTLHLLNASNFEALYYNGQRRFRPRTTSGYLFIVNPVVMPTSSTVCNTPYQGQYRCRDRFIFKPGDLASSYYQINDVEIVDFEDWTVSRMRLKSVDTTNNIAYLTGSTMGGEFWGFLPGHRYLVENAKESLNQAGEWYLDRGTTPWTLTYLANPGENPNTDTVIVPQQPQILTATGLQYVTFKNLIFSHDNYTVVATGHPGVSGENKTPAALSFNGSSNVTVSGVTICHTTQFGLEFEGTAVAGQGNTLTGSLLYDLGAGGVRLGQVPASGDADASVAQYNTITENMIFSGGRFLPGGTNTAIWMGSSHHNMVSHNDVHDFYTGAIAVGFSPNGGTTYTHDNSIDHNLLYNLGQGVTDDMGCVHFASSNNTGNSFTNNVCHDVTHDQTSTGYGGNGIYVDQNSQNVDIENNLVYRVSDSALFVNFGTENITIRNNILAYGREGELRRGPSTPGASFTATNNIFLYDLGPLQRIPGDWACQGTCTNQFVMDNNIYWNTSGAAPVFITTDPNNPDSVTQQYSLAQWQSATGEDVHSLNTNPAFAGASYPSDNYALQSGSPASSISFSAFSTDGVGPTTPLNAPSTAIPAGFPLQTLNPASAF